MGKAARKKIAAQLSIFGSCLKALDVFINLWYNKEKYLEVF